MLYFAVWMFTFYELKHSIFLVHHLHGNFIKKEICRAGVVNQSKVKSQIPYSDATKSHIKLMGSHDHHLYPFLSHENILSGLFIHILQCSD